MPLLVAAALLGGPGRAPAHAASPDLEVARQLNRAFVEVAEKVTPAVVVITVVQRTVVPSWDDEEDSPFESLPRDFWHRFHQQFPQPPEKSRAQGSGIIIRADGYILTNGHVVENAESIEVQLQDGRTFKAKVRGVDPQSDLAVVQIDAKGLPVAVLADSDKTRVGEFAIAIGSPFRLDYTVTYGHVSAKGRSNVIEGDAGAAMDQDFIQTDANINLGNSGGPLVNINGEVIGINTLIRGLHTGIGFAIPSNLAKEVSDKLIAEGKFTRPWLGLEIRALRDDPDFRELVQGVDDGVVVRSILTNGPAAKSELKPTDIITAVDGKAVSTAQQLRTELRGKKIGEPVALSVYRPDSLGKGTTLSLNIRPAEWVVPTAAPASAKRSPANPSEPADLGVTVEALTRDLAGRFGVEMTDGVVVTAVQKGTPAARKGIKPGEVITAVNQQAVTTPKQFRDALKKADLKKGVLVTLLSASATRFEILKPGAD